MKPVFLSLFASLAVATGTMSAAARAPAVDAGLQSPDPAVRAHALAAVLDRPETVDPFQYALVTKLLWEAGRRRQAAFWFYVFQERSRPWATADKAGDGAAALRASLNDGLSAAVNRWIASDPGAWRATVERALDYEKHFPLCPERPPGIAAVPWSALVNRSRADYDRATRASFATLNPAAFVASRRAAGLFVGPLQAPGPDLPNAWR